MKKIAYALLCALIIALALPLPARADMGPKPSVVIDFHGLDGQTYYATLLSSTKSTGPYSALDEGDQAYAHYQPGDENYEIFLKFVQYEDAGGYFFLQYFQDCSTTGQFRWTYHPPQEFKILLYFPEADRFVVSAASYARYAFDSYFTAEVDLDAAAIAAEKSYDYSGELFSLALRTVLTIALELGVALLFGFRERRQFCFIAAVNAATQIALNLVLGVILFRAGQMVFVFFYVLLELAVFAAEAIAYTWYLKKHSQKPVPGWKPWVYALSANTASFALGLWLADRIPSIF